MMNQLTWYQNTHSLLAFSVHDLPPSESRRFGATQELRRFFQDAGLPIPQGGEYCISGPHRRSALIFLEDYGVTLRIYPRAAYDKRMCNLPNHPLVQQPLTQVKGEHFVYVLYPGIIPGRSDNDWRKHLDDEGRPYSSNDSEEEVYDDILNNDGIDHSESGEWNRGFIPVRTNFFPHGIPIGLDPKYVATAENVMCMDIHHPASIEAKKSGRRVLRPSA